MTGPNKSSVHSWARWLHICPASESPDLVKPQRRVQLMRDFDLLHIPLLSLALSAWGNYTNLV